MISCEQSCYIVTEFYFQTILDRFSLKIGKKKQHKNTQSWIATSIYLFPIYFPCSFSINLMRKTYFLKNFNYLEKWFQNELKFLSIINTEWQLDNGTVLQQPQLPFTSTPPSQHCFHRNSDLPPPCKPPNSQSSTPHLSTPSADLLPPPAHCSPLTMPNNPRNTPSPYPPPPLPLQFRPPNARLIPRNAWSSRVWDSFLYSATT